jgi:hypothetical protein
MTRGVGGVANRRGLNNFVNNFLTTHHSENNAFGVQQQIIAVVASD